MGYAFKYIRNMFGLLDVHDIAYALPYYVDSYEVIMIFAALICSVPIFRNILNVKRENKILYGFVNVWLLALFLLSSATIAASTYNPFIYFRF